MAKTFTEFKQFLNANPEHAKAFHDYYETRREELIAVPWVQSALGLDKKAQICAAFIQDEILNEFGLKHTSRVLETD